TKLVAPGNEIGWLRQGNWLPQATKLVGGGNALRDEGRGRAASASIHGSSAREVEHRSGGKRAFLGAQPGDHCSDLLDLAEASHGDLGEHELDVRLGHLR